MGSRPLRAAAAGGPLLHVRALGLCEAAPGEEHSLCGSSYCLVRPTTPRSENLEEKPSSDVPFFG